MEKKYPNLKGSKENYIIDRHLIFLISHGISSFVQINILSRNMKLHKALERMIITFH